MKVPASKVVLALADLASNGKYDNVTRQGALNMNALFETVAELINVLEAEEAVEDAEQQELEFEQAAEETTDE